MRKLMGTAMALGVGASLMVAPGARAADKDQANQATCTYQFHVAFEPPITTDLRPSTVSTTEPGTIECDGHIQGLDITGPGTITVEGDLLATCAGHLNDGIVTVKIPVERGRRVTYRGPFTAVRAGVVAPLVQYDGAGQLAGSGYARATPDAGQNCVTGHLSSATVDGKIALVR